jgi:DnaK suppressor protein
MTTTGMLTVAQVAELRAQLEQEREIITARRAERRKGLAGTTASRPDDADWASDSVDQGLIARLMDRDAKLLREIDAALAKINAGPQGRYGICESSGEPIDLERLRARPWSRLSLGAKERRERDEAEHEQTDSVDLTALDVVA